MINEFLNPVTLELTDPTTGLTKTYLVWESTSDEWENVEVCLIRDYDGGPKGDG